MPAHMTVRMAWHDNKWNGTICCQPEKNVYCVGSYSLLSERIAREKQLNVEMKHREERIDAIRPQYIPPCFWSSNAFSPYEAKIVHIHPFKKLKHKRIDESLPPYSVFTWPFRLAWNHSPEKQKHYGSYRHDLEDQINNFFTKFKPNESIVFFYLNYDNPISADEYRYALVGCAKFSDVGKPRHFKFTEQEWAYWTSQEGMQNFPCINWAMRISYDFVNTGIRLPYHEYLNHIEKHPEDENKLREMRVLIEEDALTPRFKYVAEELNDDHCIYLLYKLQKAIDIAQGHGIVKLDREEHLIEQFLEEASKRRGLYPGLPSIIDLLVDPDSDKKEGGDELVVTIKDSLHEDEDLLEAVFELLSGKGPIPLHLNEFETIIRRARLGLRDHASLLDVLRKLSLFSLSKFQIRRILFPSQEKDELHSFGGKEVSPSDIVNNPYILCEDYVPVTKDRKLRLRELDQPEPREGPINMFNIDIGMFPDDRYLVRNFELQDLTPAGPERLRALVIEYLQQIGSDGHCFASLDAIHKNLLTHPVFYKQRISVNKEELVSTRHRQHFEPRLSVVDSDGETYFYLREVEFAEDLIESIISTLLSRKKDHKFNLTWIDGHLSEQVHQLQQSISIFDAKQFTTERGRLTRGALQKSFYVITGKPGSGKTRALKPIIQQLVGEGEDVTLLAFTGKAVLRLKEETGFKESQTIDMFIYRAGMSEVLDNYENLLTMARDSKTPNIENIIIDESSMVDLHRLAILFRVLELQGLQTVKRVILVGDENQLPPIGFGRPFYDIVTYVRHNKDLRENHYIRLETNCRQKMDKKILRAAEVFVARNRYYEELLSELAQGGKISDWLTVELWDTREDLISVIDKHLKVVIAREVGNINEANQAARLNELFGLYPTGYVKKNSIENVEVDRFQLLTPYRGGFYGTLGLNSFVRDEYKGDWWPDYLYPRSMFGHSDKLIRTSNWYIWDRSERRRVLLLSNGSIGVICNQKGHQRIMYFPDARGRIWWKRDEEENFERAYAITVHKAQGSEFDNVFVVIPERRSLLFSELIYTAFTRSKGPLTLFVQRTERESPLEIARKRSAVLARNTSLFSKPLDASRILEPEPGVHVRSMIEYNLYRTLKAEQAIGRLNFTYETPIELKVGERKVRIRPDFTVEAGGQIYYWEHLGMLDLRDYYEDWQWRRRAYEANDFIDNLITTDDLNGLKHDLVQQVIDDIINGTLKTSSDTRFSNHHYQLYEA